jgi:hypothetical protein
MRTHTPGPWRVVERGPQTRTGPALRIFGGGDDHNFPVCDPVRDDDARLIAAVPDLLAALAALVDDSWSDISGQPCVPNKATVEAARAALAKAGAR